MLIRLSLQLIAAVKVLIVPFIGSADRAAHARAVGGSPDGPSRDAILVPRQPQELIDSLKLVLPQHAGYGQDGLLSTIQSILEHSVNTWDQGFMDKLYSSTNAVCPRVVHPPPISTYVPSRSWLT